MIPYSRPKLSDFYTLSQTELVENHTLHSGTYPKSRRTSNAMTFWRHLNLAIFSAKFIRRENNVTRYFSNFSENRSFLHNHANVVKILKSEQFILHDPSLNRLFMSEK